MPPRAEEELDAVSLHNQALMNMEANATGGFQKMQFLLQQNPFPPETFGNLLLLYVKYEVSNCFIVNSLNYFLMQECTFCSYKQMKSALYLFYIFCLELSPFLYIFQYYDLAADVLAENAHLTYKYLTPVSTYLHSHRNHISIFSFVMNNIVDNLT